MFHAHSHLSGTGIRRPEPGVRSIALPGTARLSCDKYTLELADCDPDVPSSGANYLGSSDRGGNVGFGPVGARRRGNHMYHYSWRPHRVLAPHGVTGVSRELVGQTPWAQATKEIIVLY